MGNTLPDKHKNSRRLGEGPHKDNFISPEGNPANDPNQDTDEYRRMHTRKVVSNFLPAIDDQAPVTGPIPVEEIMEPAPKPLNSGSATLSPPLGAVELKE